MRLRHLVIPVLGWSLAGAIGLSGCSDDDGPAVDARVDSSVLDASAGDRGSSDLQRDEDGNGNRDAAGNADQGVDAPLANPYNSVSAVSNFFDGKTVVMEGDAIPDSPQGYDENKNLGLLTQCYHKVTGELKPGPIMAVTSELGTLVGAPNAGDVGNCDRTATENTVNFETTAILIENVAADGSCFDITLTYVGFAQEGRGMITADGKTMKLEVYFKEQATNHRCVDGPPGSSGVTVNGAAFTGDAVQVYTVEE